MLIAANIGVVDEIELIERQLAHLRRIGVDHIVVTDTGSVDGTREVLRRAAAAGELALLEVDDDSPEPFDYANRMLALTKARFAPDWIVFGDADEFLLPRDGDLRAVLAGETADVLRVTRLNVAVGTDGPLWPDGLTPDDYGHLWLVSEPIPDFERHLKAHPDTPWILGQVMPKVIARGESLDGLSMGAHSAVGTVQSRTKVSSDLLIAHLAFSDEARFRRKLANIRRVLERYADRFQGSAGWHWKRWLAIDDAGRAGEEFERQRFDRDEIARRHAEGGLATAAEWFASRPGR